MWAAKSGNAETVKLLLERGANVNAVNLAGLSALSIAHTGGRTEIESMLVKAGAEAPKEPAGKKTISDSQPAKRSK
jgi:ankyrin repeat protein